jgi:hypothetical protein
MNTIQFEVHTIFQYGELIKEPFKKGNARCENICIFNKKIIYDFGIHNQRFENIF